jgi:inorganic triphosphatase YgiF
VSGQVEREVKLDADPELVLPDLDGAIQGLRAIIAPPRELDAVYFDTDDGRLLSRGVTVRRRTGEGDRWTVKISVGPKAGGAGGSRPTEVSREEIDFLDAATEVPDKVRATLRPWIGEDALRPVVRIVSHRRRIRLARDDAGTRPVAEIDDDLVSVYAPGEEPDDGPSRLRFREIEVELSRDAPFAGVVLDAIAARLVEAGARPAPTSSKLARALDLVGPR